MQKHRLLLYFGDTLIGDINHFAKSRHLTETLKSEAASPSADSFTFSISWRKFQDFVSRYFDEDPASLLKVGKTRMVFEVDGKPRFAGWMSANPPRSGAASSQIISLTFYEYFARLSGDVVCAANNKNSPLRIFTAVPAHLYVEQLIKEFMARAAAAGETLNWSFGTVDTLNPKTMTYKDFQTVAKALCDAMNNVQGAGKFDVVFRADPNDYTHQIIDILKPRGRRKNIIIEYPGDGVYKLWAGDYSIEETNDYASEIIAAGNGQVGAPDEMTAKLGVASNAAFVKEYCYYRRYETASNLESQDAINAYAATKLAQSDFGRRTPDIVLAGRPIAWGEAENDNNGLALGDTFYFKETVADGEDNSGYYRIIALDTSWDDNGVATVKPTLIEDTDE